MYVGRSRDYRVGLVISQLQVNKWPHTLSIQGPILQELQHIPEVSGYVDITINVEPKGRQKPSPKAYKYKLKQSHNPGMWKCLYQKSKASKKEMDIQREKRDRRSWLRHEHGTCENFCQFPPLFRDTLYGLGKSPRDKYVICRFHSHPLACRHPLPFTSSSFTV